MYLPSSAGGTHLGLFAYTIGATVKNTNLTDAYIYGKTEAETNDLYIGGITAQGFGTTIDSCAVSGRMILNAEANKSELEKRSRSLHCGGVAGIMSSGGTPEGENQILNCSFDGQLLGWSLYMGGIVSVGHSITISNCTNSGIIANQYALQSSDTSNYNDGFTGGIAAHVYDTGSKITDCVNNGQVTGMRG